MKKSLLLLAVVAMGMTASAQTKWQCAGSAVDDLSGLTPTTTESNIEASAAVCGPDITISAISKTYKDVSGAAYSVLDGTLGYYNFAPDTLWAGKTIKTLADAEAMGEHDYVDFSLKINNETDFLNITAVKFKVTRIGTDACRFNVIAKGKSDTDGEYKSGFLITADNFASILTNACGSWQEVNDEHSNIEGVQPGRNDASKGGTTTADCYSSYTIPASVLKLPSDAYEFTLRFYVYGVGPNKAVNIFDVEVDHNEAQSIANVAASSKNVVVYNLLGQRVAANTKGLVIINGKKVIRK